jgi:hypothetical protein
VIYAVAGRLSFCNKCNDFDWRTAANEVSLE